MFDFALDLLGVGSVFVAPLIWLVGQVVALVVLRGPMRWLAAVPLAVMAVAILITYDSWRASSNLWPLFFILGSFPAAIVVVVALVLGKPKLSKRLMATTAIATGALVLAAFLHARAASRHRNVEQQRQNKEADAIIRALDAVVPVGAIESSDPAAVDPQAARDVVVKSGIAYNACYRQGLALEPHLGGPLAIELDIDVRGRVAAARVTQSAGAPSVERCIVDVLRGLEFARSAPAAPGARTMIAIPMQLHPPSAPTQSQSH